VAGQYSWRDGIGLPGGAVAKTPRFADTRLVAPKRPDGSQVVIDLDSVLYCNAVGPDYIDGEMSVYD
jgi:hypothetical protein